MTVTNYEFRQQRRESVSGRCCELVQSTNYSRRVGHVEATVVVHCTPIKHRENMISVLFFLIIRR